MSSSKKMENLRSDLIYLRQLLMENPGIIAAYVKFYHWQKDDSETLTCGLIGREDPLKNSSFLRHNFPFLLSFYLDPGLILTKKDKAILGRDLVGSQIFYDPFLCLEEWMQQVRKDGLLPYKGVKENPSFQRMVKQVQILPKI